ncbi:MAG: hypothetical protein ACYTGB_09595 [Planctomycetota bacterium]|jgi:hypothetical protein
METSFLRAVFVRRSAAAAAFGAALLCALSLRAGPARCGEPFESLELEVEAAGQALLLSAPPGDGPRLDPGEGLCACLFRYDRLQIENLSQVTVLGSGGRQFPLMIESSSVFKEFGKIVGLRFYLLVPAGQARPGSDTFVLRWGPGVEAENSEVETVCLDPDLADAYRGLKAVSLAPDSAGTITVIADSSADYHFLWYLVPIGLIFFLLTLRKLAIGRGAAGEGEGGGDPGSSVPA